MSYKRAKARRKAKAAMIRLKKKTKPVEVFKKYEPEFRERSTPLEFFKREPIVVTESMKVAERCGSVMTMPGKPKACNWNTSDAPRRYDDEEMMEREAKARAIAERRKTMVAPMYNKGGYQYIGDVPDDIVKTLGRKV